MKYFFSALIICSFTNIAWAEKCMGQEERECLKQKKAALELEIDKIDARLKILDKPHLPQTQDSSDFWLSLDLGIDVIGGAYGGVGVSLPLGPIYASPGIWFGRTYDKGADMEMGYYLSLGYSWMLYE